MADVDVKVTGFKELSELLYSLGNGATADRIQAKALRAAGNVIKAELVPATPIRVSKPNGKDLPVGALRDAVRVRVALPDDGTAPSATVDFGKLTYIAHFVDEGHVNVLAKKGRTHTPAHPFIRSVEESTRAEANEAYLETLQAEINKEIEQ